MNPAETYLDVFVGSDSRKTWRVNLGVNGGRDEEGGWNARVGPFVQLQPSGRLQVSVGTNYSFGQDVAQWITNQDVTGNGQTDHVYGQLRRDVIDVTGRVTYTFHRDLTLQAFLQPFVAVGDYTDIKRLARPSSFAFEPATIDFDPDFNRTCSAATWCCAGNTSEAVRCLSSGTSRPSATGGRASLRRWQTLETCSAARARTSSWSR